LRFAARRLPHCQVENAMRQSLSPILDLIQFLTALDGKAFHSYRKLQGKVYAHDRYSIRFFHIQGSPGAFPASVCHLGLTHEELGLADWSLACRPRKIATADYLLRAFQLGVEKHARQNRGVQGSGSFQPISLPPQVLERNIVHFGLTDVRIAFRVSLPGSHDNRILGRHAALMFSEEMSVIVDTLKEQVCKTAQFKKHCDVVEDMVFLQQQLHGYGLVAFVGDGAVLARRSGVSQAPLTDGAVVFRAPAQMAVEVMLPNAGRQRGLGIRPGVNVLIGGGFHGKSTLLDALSKGVYPHIPGDGRERVVTHPEAFFICAEEGRAVNDLDITGFINNLPGGVDAERFSTNNASGSTSEAAAIVEAVQAGARLLLIDEDSSATNLLIKDRNMRKLIPEDPITPLFDRVRELFRRFGVSTLIVAGGSSDYLGVADHVIAMRNYLPVSMTDRLRGLTLAEPGKPAKPLMFEDKRRVLAESFDPSYRAERIGKTIAVRIKPLRLQERVLEFGNAQLDLTKLKALADPSQALAIGYALLLAGRICRDSSLSPSDLARTLCERIEKEGLAVLSPNKDDTCFFALPRRLELAAAINRLRRLKVVLGKDETL